jgi:hypothetical protein
VVVGLDRERLESTLPHAAGGRVFRVVPTHVRGEHPVHPARKIRGTTRLNYQMNVIWHEARRQNGQLEPFLRASDQSQELAVVGWLMKDLSSLVAPIEHVIAVLGRD